MKLVKSELNHYNIVDSDKYLNEYDYEDPYDAINALEDSGRHVSNVDLKRLRDSVICDFLIIQDGKAFIITANKMTVKPEYTILTLAGEFVSTVSHQATITDLSKVDEVIYNNKTYRNEC